MNIMPFKNIELFTSLSKEEAETILNENIQPKKGLEFKFGKPNNQKTFEGSFSGGQFVIQRVINYRNSFRPQITGNIKNGNGETRIIANLKMHGFIIAFMVVWLGGISLATIGTVYNMFAQGITSLYSVIPLIMLIFGAGMVYFGFNYEADKSINALKRILKARIKE